MTKGQTTLSQTACPQVICTRAVGDGFVNRPILWRVTKAVSGTGVFASRSSSSSSSHFQTAICSRDERDLRFRAGRLGREGRRVGGRLQTLVTLQFQLSFAKNRIGVAEHGCTCKRTCCHVLRPVGISASSLAASDTIFHHLLQQQQRCRLPNSSADKHPNALSHNPMPTRNDIN